MSEIHNRRNVIRFPVLMKARIIFNDGNSELACFVRDLSDRGARLKIDTVVAVPSNFALHVMEAPPLRCRLAWQANQELGVLFD